MRRVVVFRSIAAIVVAALGMAIPVPTLLPGRAGPRDAPPALEPHASVIYVGDSLTARSHRVIDGAGSAQGHVTWAQLLSGDRLRLIRNAGVAGDTAAGTWKRLQRDVLDHNPGVVVYLAGINDIKGSPGAPAEQVQESIALTLGALYEAGAWTILLTVPPSILVDTASEKTELAKLNRWIRARARAQPRVTVVDVYPLVANRADTFDSGPLSWAPGLSDDGTHPNAAGARRIGEAVAAAISGLFPPDPDLPGSTADPLELVPNPLLVGDSAGLADGLTAMTFSGATPMTTKIARSDLGIGAEWQQVTVVGRSSHKIQQSVTTGFSVGDTVVATFEIEEDPGDYLESHATVLEAWGVATTLGSTSLVALGSERIASGVVRLPRFTIPPGTLSLRLYHRVSTGPGGATWRIGRMSLVKAS